MTTDTKLKELIINKLTTSQYESIEEKDPNQIYIVTDALAFDDTITNCLTHIPQDIKLELVDGTLTAKQGSKVWIPYGTTEAYQVGDIDVYGHTVVATSWDGVNFFYAIELQSDFTATANQNKQETVYYSITEGARLWGSSDMYSGATEPTGSINMVWYDTSTNLMKYKIGSNPWVDCDFSLPIGLVTANTTQLISIDQIFNGFGYIGSTIFALPDVRGLIANGRNADGSLRNIEITLNKVSLTTLPNEASSTSINLGLTTDGAIDVQYLTLNKDENFNYNGSNQKVLEVEFASMGVSSGKIFSLTPKTTFQAIDRSDSSWLSGLSMPSDKYIDLPLGASGSLYTAPANGWVFIAKTAGQNNAFVNLAYASNGEGVIVHVPAAGNVCKCFLLVRKGKVFKVDYSATGATSMFRFYYAQGEIE